MSKVWVNRLVIAVAVGPLALIAGIVLGIPIASSIPPFVPLLRALPFVCYRSLHYAWGIARSVPELDLPYMMIALPLVRCAAAIYREHGAVEADNVGFAIHPLRVVGAGHSLLRRRPTWCGPSSSVRLIGSLFRALDSAL